MLYVKKRENKEIWENENSIVYLISKVEKEFQNNNMKNRKYADGYLPKIAYHISKSNSEKVNYFTERHETKYGKLGANDINKIIDMVMELAIK